LPKPAEAYELLTLLFLLSSSFQHPNIKIECLPKVLLEVLALEIEDPRFNPAFICSNVRLSDQMIYSLTSTLEIYHPRVI
jgi:hypothetical protein